MADERLNGLTIEIGADTKKFNKAIDDSLKYAERQIADIDKALARIGTSNFGGAGAKLAADKAKYQNMREKLMLRQAYKPVYDKGVEKLKTTGQYSKKSEAEILKSVVSAYSSRRESAISAFGSDRYLEWYSKHRPASAMKEYGIPYYASAGKNEGYASFEQKVKEIQANAIAKKEAAIAAQKASYAALMGSHDNSGFLKFAAKEKDMANPSPAETKSEEKSEEKKIHNSEKLLSVIGKIGVAAKKGALGIGKMFAAAAARSTKNKTQSLVKGINDGMNKLTKKFTSFAGAFKRVALYKTIRSLIGLIVKGTKLGVTNLYNYSRTFGTTFKKTLDEFKTSAVFVANAFAAMAAPLLNYVQPAITSLMDQLAELANMAAGFIAALTGQKQYSRAIRKVQEFGQAVKKQLFGFDELNVLNGNGNEASGMFEEAVSDIEDGSFLSKILKAVEVQQWGSVGKIIGNRFNEMVSKIDIDSMAKKLGKKINNIVDLVNGLGDEIKWHSIGARLSSGLNSLIETIEPADLGKALTQKVNAIVGIVKGFVEGFNWSGAGKWLSSVLDGWLRSIKWQDVVSTIAGTINGFFSMARTFIESTDWNEKARHLAYLVNRLVIITDWKGIGATLNSFVNGIFEGAKTFLSTLDWKSIGIKVQEFLKAIDWKTIFKNVASVIWQAIKGALIALTASDVGVDDLILKQSAYDNLGKRRMSGQTYASGGVVPTGQLFIANEAGPELVGQVGGKTTVTNQEQFVAGLRGANEEVVNAVLAIGNAIVSSIDNKDTATYLDGSKIGDSTSRWQNAQNRRFVKATV